MHDVKDGLFYVMTALSAPLTRFYSSLAIILWVVVCKL